MWYVGTQSCGACAPASVGPPHLCKRNREGRGCLSHNLTGIVGKKKGVLNRALPHLFNRDSVGTGGGAYVTTKQG